MDGATVSRATLHNSDIFKRFQMGIGDSVVDSFQHGDSAASQEHGLQRYLRTAGNVPLLRGGCCTRKEENTTFLYCSNPLSRRFGPEVCALLRTDENEYPGLSEATLTKFVDKGWLTTFGDLYELGRYKDQIIQENGFGSRSFERLQRAIDRSRKLH